MRQKLYRFARTCSLADHAIVATSWLTSFLSELSRISPVAFLSKTSTSYLNLEILKPPMLQQLISSWFHQLELTQLEKQVAQNFHCSPSRGLSRIPTGTMYRRQSCDSLVTVEWLPRVPCDNEVLSLIPTATNSFFSQEPLNLTRSVSMNKFTNGKKWPCCQHSGACGV